MEIAPNKVSLLPTWPTRLLGVLKQRNALRISAWVRWFAIVAWLAQLHQHVGVSHPAYGTHIFSGILLLLMSAYVYYCAETRKGVSWRWLLAQSAMDIAMLTGGLTISFGPDSNFFVLYFAALALFGAVCTSLRLSLLVATMIAGIHTALSLPTERSNDLPMLDGTGILTNAIAMYFVVAVLSLTSSFEQVRSRLNRLRRKEAVERERELQKERIELSQTIHDTIAQSAFAIGLGLETAIELTEDSKDKNRSELACKLKAMHSLSKSTMWELRHPIDAGAIFEGRELNRVLRSHASTFAAITSIPTELIQSGDEPDIPTDIRRLLFSIAHNAMTNAFRHAHAERIKILLSFGETELRMSIIDNGIGLAEGYTDSGHGFRNMRADAERMGGRLDAGPGDSYTGTTVTCVIPYEAS